MKRLIVAGMILYTAFLCNGDVSVGLNLTSRSITSTEKISSEGGTSSETGEGSYELGIRPSVIIFVGDHLEVVPFAGFTHYVWRQTLDGKVRQENGNSGFDIGCGFYFRIIKGEILRFSIGPQGTYDMNFPQDSDAFSSGFTLGAPANIDLCFNDRFFMRASPVLVQFGYGFKRINEHQSRSVTSFNVITENGLSLGFFFTF